MRAILLAAGEGKRLRPLTADRPKCMVEYRGTPLIDHILRTLRSCDVTDLWIIKGYLAEVLRREDTEEAVNHEFASTNMVHTLFCAREAIRGDVMISYTDIIYRETVVRALQESPHDISVVVDRDWRALWQARMEDPLSDAETLKLDEEGRILELGKRPRSLDEIEGQYIGLLKLSPAGARAFVEHYDGLDREAMYDGKDFRNMYMTSFIQSLINSGVDVHAVPISGGWLEVDEASDLEIDLDHIGAPKTGE